MDQFEQINFLQYVAEKNIPFDSIDLERDTPEEARAKIDSLSAGVDLSRKLFQ